MHLPLRPVSRRSTTRSATSLAAFATVAVTGAALLSAPTVGAAAAPPSPFTDRISVTTGGFHPGSGDGGADRGTERRMVSDDGRFVVFEASAPLVKRQGTLNWQIMLRDRKLGTTKAISRNRAGALANGKSSNPAISANGRWITYQSAANNLVADDTNEQTDIFHFDTRTGVTTLVNRRTDGGQTTRNSGPASLSANGRFVSFMSPAGGLAAGDTDNRYQAYVHDTATGATELVSVGTDGLGRSVTTSTSVSADGQRVLFESLDADVAPGADNLDIDVFLRDRSTGTTRKVAGHKAGAGRSSISADGRFAVYQSTDNEIDPIDNNNKVDVFVVDLATGEHTLVSKSSSGIAGNDGSEHGSISRDGRYVTFTSRATNLVSGDTNGAQDVFRHDFTTGTTIRVSTRSNGAQESYGGVGSSISGDGQHVIFRSFARDLTPHPTGSWGQTFVRDLNGAWPAMIAAVGPLPKKVKPAKKFKVKTSGIGAAEQLTVVWKAKGKTAGKKKTTQTVRVKRNKLTIKAGSARGKYAVTIRYDGRVLRKQVVSTK